MTTTDEFPDGMSVGDFADLVRELLTADPRIADVVPVKMHPAETEPSGLSVRVALPMDLDFQIEIHPA